jgi:hypothetical protein
MALLAATASAMLRVLETAVQPGVLKTTLKSGGF